MYWGFCAFTAVDINIDAEEEMTRERQIQSSGTACVTMATVGSGEVLGKSLSLRNFTDEDDDAEVINSFFEEVDTDKDMFISLDELEAARANNKGQGKVEVIEGFEGLVRSLNGIEGPAQTTKISKDQFIKAVRELPRVRGERVRWAGTLGLDGHLARLLPKGDIFDGLRGLKDLANEMRGIVDVNMPLQIEMVCREFSARLPGIICEELRKLHAIADAVGSKSEVEALISNNTKFSMDGAYLGNFATLNAFYAGPEKLIGSPDPNIMEGVKKEHTLRKNAHVRFETSNYFITTWPALEFEFVAEPSGNASKYPHTPEDTTQWEVTHKSGQFKDQWKKWRGKFGRKVIKLKELMETFEVKQQVRRAGILIVEVICLRLYTGPMFVLYNASLRGFPAKDVQCLLGNKYETTIFVIASGITKLSKVSDIPPKRTLWRGLGGMVLPEQFWRNMIECVISVKVKTAASKAQSVVETIKQHIKESDEGVLHSTLKCKVLNLRWGLSMEAQARVVSDARVDEDAVLMTLALDVSKFKLLKENLDSICESVKACGGNGALEVIILDISEKPYDFKGGGEHSSEMNDENCSRR